MPDPILTVVVSGPGHHDRADAAADLIAQLSTLGRVGVHAELRPRLAADVDALLEAGAAAVRLAGDRTAGVFGGAARELVDVDILVELAASADPITATVVDATAEPSVLADAVRQAVAAWNRVRSG